MVKGDSVSVGAAQKKMLADITNLDQHQHRLQPSNQQPKHHPAPAPDVSADVLLKVYNININI